MAAALPLTASRRCACPGGQRAQRGPGRSAAGAGRGCRERVGRAAPISSQPVELPRALVPPPRALASRQPLLLAPRCVPPPPPPPPTHTHTHPPSAPSPAPHHTHPPTPHPLTPPTHPPRRSSRRPWRGSPPGWQRSPPAGRHAGQVQGHMCASVGTGTHLGTELEPRGRLVGRAATRPACSAAPPPLPNLDDDEGLEVKGGLHLGARLPPVAQANQVGEQDAAGPRGEGEEGGEGSGTRG